MKKLLCIFAITLAAFTVSSSARAVGGSDNPFPLDYPIKFPWNSIEGVWQVASGGTTSLFSFEVQNDCAGRQILKVFQLDSSTHEVIAEGTGFKQDNSFEIYAVMKSQGVQNYVIHIGAYRDTHSVPPKKMIVLRVLPFTPDLKEQDFRIVKLPGSVPVQHVGEDATTCSLN